MSEINRRGRYANTSPRRRSVPWWDKAILAQFEVTVFDVLIALFGAILAGTAVWAVAFGAWIEAM